MQCAQTERETLCLNSRGKERLTTCPQPATQQSTNYPVELSNKFQCAFGSFEILNALTKFSNTARVTNKVYNEIIEDQWSGIF